MALDNIHLRKLLKILFLEPSQRQSELRKDIRDELSHDAGRESGGGDFHVPFWADAKSHIFGKVDLHASVAARIAANESKARLYPMLRDGFLLWWNERRRWTNEPFRQGEVLKTRFPFPGLDATIKVDGILSVRDGRDEAHVVYPYFSEKPELSEHAARLGLWLLVNALPSIPPQEIRILDVIRGRTFSIDRLPLLGNEEVDLQQRYAATLETRARLRKEYD